MFVVKETLALKCSADYRWMLLVCFFGTGIRDTGKVKALTWNNGHREEPDEVSHSSSPSSTAIQNYFGNFNSKGTRIGSDPESSSL